MRSKLGRTAGMCVECVGVVWDCATGVVGVERYTIPVPVRGLSLAPPPGADEEDELRVGKLSALRIMKDPKAYRSA